jgi:hypothetical protein
LLLLKLIEMFRHAICYICTETVPKGNLAMHEANCARILRKQMGTSQAKEAKAGQASTDAPEPAQKASTPDASSDTAAIEKQTETPVEKKKKQNKAPAEKAPKPAKPKSLSDHLATMDSDDEDAILDAAIAATNRCWVPKCKESVKLMNVICPHCRNKYCLYHSMPEV